jgi:hypothetical protein
LCKPFFVYDHRGLNLKALRIDAETMLKAIAIGQEKLCLAVVPVYNFRHIVAKLFQLLAGFMNVGGRPVKADAIIIFRFYGGPGALVEPEV